MQREIAASFKQATVKGGTATLQFDVHPDAANFLDIVKIAGTQVRLTVATAQEEMDLDAAGDTVATAQEEMDLEDAGVEEEPYEREVEVVVPYRLCGRSSGDAEEGEPTGEDGSGDEGPCGCDVAERPGDLGVEDGWDDGVIAFGGEPETGGDPR